MPSRRRKASDRSETNQKESKQWVQESEGIKDHQCTNKGASSEKRPFFRVLMHACTHLCGTSKGVCVRDCRLHVSAKELGFAPILYTVLAAGLSVLDRYVIILYSPKPKHGICSCLSVCAASYAWHPENSPSVTSV